MNKNRYSSVDLSSTDACDFRSLYECNETYVTRRDPNSYAAKEISLEAREFKVPNLLRTLPSNLLFSSIIEIGCATGEVLEAFPDTQIGGDEIIKKIGFDLSPSNIAAAKHRYPHITFFDSDFSAYTNASDLVVLSDILEHVPDDVSFLKKASNLAPVTLINLPLEDNWTNRNRNYGVEDESGHLRAYSLEDGFKLVENAGLRVLKWHRVWVHETDYDLLRRNLRREFFGAAHSGPLLLRGLKTIVYYSARILPPFGRRLFPSNLFMSASK